MKRKLNENDEPEPAPAAFDGFGLDPRILQAVVKEKYAKPTPVQAKAIPLALEGRDILARAKTGSGKTAAYVLPIIQSILRNDVDNNRAKSTKALILCPTKELANQVTKSINTLSKFCAKEVQAVNLTPQINEQAQRALLSSTPAIVVATPARALQHLNSSALVVDGLAHLVIDESDLILSYGYEDDLRSIVKLIPRGVQTFLASATLTTEVGTLKELFCDNPAVLDLYEEDSKSNALTQYVVKCAEDEKFLLIFALFKLKLIKGKCIVFVADIDRCYRVKLFLEQFGIKSCVLNSELPVNSRIHVVEEFNKNVYDIIIATDEHEVVGTESEQRGASLADLKSESNEGASNTTTKSSKPAKIPANRSRKDREYGISRGIDFHAVACVLNFDLPPSPRSYTHRIGRTARAQRSGTALSFAVPAALYKQHKPTSHPSAANDDAVLAAIAADQTRRGSSAGADADASPLQPYAFDRARLDGFRYRVGSALKAVSAGAVREARVRELRQELLHSQRLARHLEENPEDLAWLRHDAELRPARVQPHMRHVPGYLMAGVNGGGAKGMQEVGNVGGGSKAKDKGRDGVRGRKGMLKRRGGGGKRTDPLKTFNATGRKK